jgi:hypothetical protein
MNLAEITGLEQGIEIDDEQLMALINEQKVNVMIHHAPASAGVPRREAMTYCYIDDLNHRFQQR